MVNSRKKGEGGNGSKENKNVKKADKVLERISKDPKKEKDMKPY